MHNHYIDELIKYKLNQLELVLDPADWQQMAERIARELENHISQKLSSYQVEIDSDDWPRLKNLLDQAFDAQIKQILLTHKISLHPEDWSLLASQLSEEPFDDSIARALHGYEVPTNTEDWNHFVSKLDDHHLDTDLRQKLEALHFETEPNDWEVFASKIETTFDDQIREKLGDIQFNVSPEDWSAMISKLDGDSLYSQVTEKLEDFQYQGSKQDWPAMEDKLNQPLYTAFQEKFAFLNLAPEKHDWKAMEARLQEDEDTRAPILLPWYARTRVYLTAAIVVFLLGLAPFWSGESNLLDSLRNNVPLAEQNEREDLISSPGTDTEDLISSSSAATGSLSPGESNSISLGQAGSQLAQGAINSLATTTAREGISAHNALYEDPNVIDAQPTREFTMSQELHDGIPGYTPEVFVENEENRNTETASSTDAIHREGLLRKISFHSFANPWKMHRGAYSQDIKKVSLTKRKRPPFRLGVYTGSSKSAVELNSLRDPSKWKLGETFRAGLTAEFKMTGNLNFVTGIIYGRRRFEHAFQYTAPAATTSLSLTSSGTSDRLVQADIQVVQIPLLVRAYAPSKGNLSMYVQGGLIPMVSLKENYNLWNGESSIEDPETSQNWNFNTYPGNINLAIGLEYRFNNNFALQYEPYGILSLQQTKGSGSLNLRKKMYTIGLSVSAVYGFSGK